MEHMPGGLLAQAFARRSVSPVHRPEGEPSASPAAEVHASIDTLTQAGIGIVRMRPRFPLRSTMDHRPSRCWSCAKVSAATSERRRPHPRRTARMARSRRPLIEYPARSVGIAPAAATTCSRHGCLSTSRSSRERCRRPTRVQSARCRPPRPRACGYRHPNDSRRRA
jgi:hypothetical protein